MTRVGTDDRWSIRLPPTGRPANRVNFFNDEEDRTQQPGFRVDMLGAYDGHKVRVGRVVTDSSFHHYLDLNLIGDPCASTGRRQQGFTTAPARR